MWMPGRLRSSKICVSPIKNSYIASRNARCCSSLIPIFCWTQPKIFLPKKFKEIFRSKKAIMNRTNCHGRSDSKPKVKKSSLPTVSKAISRSSREVTSHIVSVKLHFIPLYLLLTFRFSKKLLPVREGVFNPMNFPADRAADWYARR